MIHIPPTGLPVGGFVIQMLIIAVISTLAFPFLPSIVLRRTNPGPQRLVLLSRGHERPFLNYVFF